MFVWMKGLVVLVRRESVLSVVEVLVFVNEFSLSIG